MDKRTKRIHVNDSSAFIALGRTGENEFRTVEIDISGWIDNDAEYRIIYSRPDGITYSVPATRNGDILTWIPNAYDVELCGFGMLEVRAYIDDIIGKSAVFKTSVDKSIETDETEPGTVRPDWIDDIIDKVVIDKIEQTETSAEDGGRNVFTVTLTNGDTATFAVRNGSKGSKGDTGEKGEKGDTGEKGYTPQYGVDYWTEKDKEELVSAVLNALPNGDEVSY